MTDGRSAGWSSDFLISATVHRHIIAQKAVAAARAQVVECDADAKRAGLKLSTLRRASEKAQMTAADHKREADADAYVLLMQTVAFGACSEQPETGALSRPVPRRTVASHTTDGAT